MDGEAVDLLHQWGTNERAVVAWTRCALDLVFFFAELKKW